MLIDSHCHLTDEQFDPDRPALLDRARAAGVSGFVVIGASGAFVHNEKALALARQQADVFAVLGVHPHEATTITPETYRRLRTLARQPEVVGLGETGLDFYYQHSPRADQRRHFRAFIRLAQELDLPLSMHIRDAYDEAARLLREEGDGRLRGVMHCFTGTAQEARSLLELGLYLSFSGIVTFKSAGALREVARQVPLNRMLVETDCPFLAPVPFRGKRNEPARVVRVAQTLARVKDRPLSAIAEATARNTRSLFRLPV